MQAVRRMGEGWIRSEPLRRVVCEADGPLGQLEGRGPPICMGSKIFRNF